MFTRNWKQTWQNFKHKVVLKVNKLFGHTYYISRPLEKALTIQNDQIKADLLVFICLCKQAI